jgi:hypothetical protein
MAAGDGGGYHGIIGGFPGVHSLSGFLTVTAVLAGFPLLKAGV